MSYHFSMGAINKLTNNYEYPKIANKKHKYICPSCEQGVIFKKGKIKQPHFAHYKSDNPCYNYDKPSETQIHKDAKWLMKSLLDNKKHITINRRCNYCEQRNCVVSEEKCYNIYDDYNEDTKAVIEYKFYYNNSNRSADIALIENDKIKYIFEICYKNKTKEENRPEPWVEINAEYLINKINSGEIIDEEGNITIECMRNYKCYECVNYEECAENENKRRNSYYEKIRQDEIENKRLENERNEFLIKEKENKWRETLKQMEEGRIMRAAEEERLRQLCGCNLMIRNICMCETPKYQLNKLSNNLFCLTCTKWKCRCQ